MRDSIRLKHYSLRTEETYVHWIKRFIHFHGKRHPRELRAREVTAFLNHLVKNRNVAAATQNQALAALLYLYREVLAEPLAWLDGLERAKRSAWVPTVLSTAEVGALLARMTGTKWLMASLLYGAGLRLRECLTLRVKDLDFDYRQIIVRQGKGVKDRRTMMPAMVVEPLKAHLLRVKTLHEKDLAHQDNSNSPWGYTLPARGTRNFETLCGGLNSGFYTMADGTGGASFCSACRRAEAAEPNPC